MKDTQNERKTELNPILMQSLEFDRNAIFTLIKEAVEARLLASGAGAFDVANIDFTNGTGERAQVKLMTVNMMHKKLPMQLG